jgi:tetratricopeptide (TPR) repeat protein
MATKIDDPSYPGPLSHSLSLASEKILANHPRQALAILTPLFKIYPDYTVVFTLAGMAYGKIGKNDQAAKMEKRALVLDPSNVSARVSLGIAYGNTGYFRKEIREERKVLARDPNNEVAWQSLGWAYGSLGQWKKARLAEKKALSIRPDDANARMILGLALAHEGFLQEALIMEESAQKLAPSDEGVKRSITYIKQTMNPPVVHKKHNTGFNPLLTPTPGTSESTSSPGSSQQLPPSPVKPPSVLH